MFLAMKVFQAKKFSSLFQRTIVTVIKDLANGYFLSFVVKVLPELLPKTNNSVGIDLGIKTKAGCRDVTRMRHETHSFLCNVPTW